MSSDLKYQKGKWHHVLKDDSLEPVSYEKEAKLYYEEWRKKYGNEVRVEAGKAS